MYVRSLYQSNNGHSQLLKGAPCMGSYTTFRFDATLRKDTPQELLDFIKYRLTPSKENQEEFNMDIVPEGICEHPFFKCYRWSWVLTWHNCNANGFKACCKEELEGLRIHIDTSLKNYCDSIEWFLLWIAPMVNLEFPCTIFREIDDSDYDSSPVT